MPNLLTKPDTNKNKVYKRYNFEDIILPSSESHEAIGNQMQDLFGKGNVDLLNRPVIQSSKLANKGWKNTGDGISTVFTNSFISNQNGKDVMLQISPILPNGDVLSEEELRKYIQSLHGSYDILQKDNVKNGGLGLIINVDTNTSISNANDWAQKLHLFQEKYYGK